MNRHTLDNGLTVLLEESHAAPLASVWSWYRVGSRNERPGITGLAHLMEHMNFKGTERLSREEMKAIVERAGGSWNGYTWLDVTTYLETLSSRSLDDALLLEAERMHACLLREEDLATERTVVLSEQEGGENDPEELLDIEVTAASILAHPYHWPTIGWESDLRAITIADVRDWYRTYYAPSNAILVVVGDFDEGAALAAVRARFESIPAGPPIPEVRTREKTQAGERRVRIEKPGNADHLRLACVTPGASHPDFVPVLALATILAGAQSTNLWTASPSRNADRSSRLYRALVEPGLAARAGATKLPTLDPFPLFFHATAREGVPLADVEAALVRAIDALRGGGIEPREMERARNQLRARAVFDSDSVTERAHQLGYFETLGCPGFLDEFEARVRALATRDVERVAAEYLAPARRTTGWFVAERGAS